MESSDFVLSRNHPRPCRDISRRKYFPFWLAYFDRLHLIVFRYILYTQDDEVAIYRSQADLDSDDGHLQRFTGKFRIGSPPERTCDHFPKGPVLVRGNTLRLQFSTSAMKPNGDEMFGFRCTVTGYVSGEEQAAAVAAGAGAAAAAAATAATGAEVSPPREDTRRSLISLEKALAVTVSQVGNQLLRPSASLLMKDDERVLLDRLSTPLLQGTYFMPSLKYLFHCVRPVVVF